MVRETGLGVCFFNFGLRCLALSGMGKWSVVFREGGIWRHGYEDVSQEIAQVLIDPL